MYIRLTLDQTRARLLRWIETALHKGGDRPPLDTVHITKDRILGCDGFRIHVVETAGFAKKGEDLPKGTIKMFPEKVKVNDVWKDLHPWDVGEFPDMSLAIAVNTVEEDFYDVDLDPKLLIQALHGFTDRVTVRVRSKPHAGVELFGKFKGDDREHNTYALVIPVQLDEDDNTVKSYWKPK